MLKKILLSIFTAGLLSSPVFISQVATALDSNAEGGFNTGISQVGGPSGDTLAATIQNIVNILLFIAGIIAVIVIVVGGIRFITSDGNPQAADKARNSIVYALVGLVVAVLSYAIVNFILAQV